MDLRLKSVFTWYSLKAQIWSQYQNVGESLLLQKSIHILLQYILHAVYVLNGREVDISGKISYLKVDIYFLKCNETYFHMGHAGLINTKGIQEYI